MSTGNFTWFTMFWNLLAVPIQNAEQPITAALQGWVLGWFSIAVGAYLVAILLMAALNPGSESSTLLFRKVFLAGAVWSIAASSAGFAIYVAGFILGLVNGISNAIVGLFGGAAVTSASAFDGAANQLIAIGVVVWGHIPKYGYVDGFLLGGILLFYFLAAVIVVGFLFLLYLLSNVILGFLIAFGPIFVACFMFPFARRFFDGWLGVVMAAVVTQIFIVGLMTMFISVLTAFVAHSTVGLSGGGGANIVNEAIALIVLIAVCGLFVWIGYHLASLAQSIASGAHAQLSTMPIGRPRGAGGGGGGGSSGGGGGGSGGGEGGMSLALAPAPRPYAFQRSIGSGS